MGLTNEQKEKLIILSRGYDLENRNGNKPLSQEQLEYSIAGTELLLSLLKYTKASSFKTLEELKENLKTYEEKVRLNYKSGDDLSFKSGTSDLRYLNPFLTKVIQKTLCNIPICSEETLSFVNDIKKLFRL